MLKPTKNKNNFQGLLLWMIIILLGVYLLNYYYKSAHPAREISFTEFMREVESGNVKDVTLTINEVKGELKKTENNEMKFFKTISPYADQKPLVEILQKNNVVINTKAQNEAPLWFIISQYLPIILIVLFFVMLMRQSNMGGGSQAFSFGRSRAKLWGAEKKKVTFKDVAGVDEAVQELKEVVDFLKAPQKYRDLGARIPKGVLLLGAPGTGKTLLGRAIAGEAGVPFFYISGSDFVEMFVGVGASRVRDTFEQGKKSAPCIVFVDEIDAVGRQRGAGLGGGHDEREQTLNQLLVEMDGFEVNSGVIIIAATNRPDVLDPALLRPGRFDRHIVVDKPDIAGRKFILEIHSREKPLDKDVDLSILARRTPGFSGADLENLLNEAALLTARNNEKTVTMKSCEESIDRVMMGPERKSRLINEKEKNITAYHEAGHALVAKLLPDAEPVRKVTILPRGMALGATWQMPEEDKYMKNKSELLAEVKVLLAGRVSEEIVFNEMTTGASNDIKVATDILRKMVCKYGMSDKLGPLALGKSRDQVFLGRDMFESKDYSDDVARQIDLEIKQLVDQCYAESKRLLEANREKLEKLVSRLKEKEVIEGSEIDEIINNGN